MDFLCRSAPKSAYWSTWHKDRSTKEYRHGDIANVAVDLAKPAFQLTIANSA
jgi:hypothetical protein